MVRFQADKHRHDRSLGSHSIGIATVRHYQVLADALKYRFVDGVRKSIARAREGDGFPFPTHGIHHSFTQATSEPRRAEFSCLIPGFGRGIREGIGRVYCRPDAD